MPLLDHAGAAVESALVADIGNTALTFDLSSTTGWPSGGANGKFYATFDPGGATEETVLVNSRSGATCTIASLADRGKAGTSAIGHSAGAKIIHGFPSDEAHDNNQHIYNLARDDHTQYMAASGTRHDLAARHTFAALGWSPGTPTAVTANQAASQGAGTHPARDTHVHAGPVTATPVAIGTALSAGSGTALALANHVHELGAASIDLSALFAAGVVDSAALGAGSVIAGKIANGAIDTTARLVDAIVTQAKMGLEDPTNFNPSAGSFSSGNNLTVGAGGSTFGYYFKFGRLCVGWAGFVMDGTAAANLPSGSAIRVPLPFNQKTLGLMRGFVAGRARRSSDGFIASGTGVIVGGTNVGTNIATAGSSAEWDATTPFNWGTPGDGAANFDSVFFMVADI